MCVKEHTNKGIYFVYVNMLRNFKQCATETPHFFKYHYPLYFMKDAYKEALANLCGLMLFNCFAYLMVT